MNQQRALCLTSDEAIEIRKRLIDRRAAVASDRKKKEDDKERRKATAKAALELQNSDEILLISGPTPVGQEALYCMNPRCGAGGFCLRSGDRIGGEQ